MGMREALGLCPYQIAFGKKYLVVKADLKDTATSFYQCSDCLGVCCLDLSFHTGSFGQIVSFTTIFDCYMHLSFLILIFDIIPH